MTSTGRKTPPLPGPGSPLSTLNCAKRPNTQAPKRAKPQRSPQRRRVSSLSHVLRFRHIVRKFFNVCRLLTLATNALPIPKPTLDDNLLYSIRYADLVFLLIRSDP